MTGSQSCCFIKPTVEHRCSKVTNRLRKKQSGLQTKTDEYNGRTKTIKCNKDKDDATYIETNYKYIHK